MIVSLLAIVLGLVLVVGIHEAGHAIAAYIFRVRIQRVSIGFGRPLLRIQTKHKCEWVWSLWPLGGYVLLLNSRITPVSSKEASYCFDKKPVLVRIIILVCGALANVMVAWLAFTFIFMLGYQQVPPVIASVTSPSVASVAGLQAGDRLIRVGGRDASSWHEVSMQLLIQLGDSKTPIEVRDKTGAHRFVIADLSHWNTKQKGLLSQWGITPALSKNYQQHIPGLTIVSAMQKAGQKTMYFAYFLLQIVKKILLGKIPLSALTGPLSLFTDMIHAFSQGIITFLLLVANLSLAVALINLFPIPGLDGGSIVYAFVEKIRGKAIPVHWEILLHRLATIIFAVIFVQLILNDLRALRHVIH